MIRLFGLAVLLASSVTAQAQSPVERGKYLVDTVMTCHNCHTPMGPNGPQFDKALSKGSWDELITRLKNKLEKKSDTTL